jgi:hypothetical protein
MSDAITFCASWSENEVGSVTFFYYLAMKFAPSYLGAFHGLSWITFDGLVC